KRLMANFEATLEELFSAAAPETLLDVGCGEGVLTHQWATRPNPPERVVGIDLDDPLLHAEWENRRAPNLEYMVMKAEALPLAVPVDHAARAPWRAQPLATTTGTRAARASSRSASRRPASSRSRTSPSPATSWTSTTTAPCRCCGRCCSSSSRSSTGRSSSC